MPPKRYETKSKRFPGCGRPLESALTVEVTPWPDRYFHFQPDGETILYERPVCMSNYEMRCGDGEHTMVWLCSDCCVKYGLKW